LRRLDAAVASLEAAVAEPHLTGEVPLLASGGGEEADRLRMRCDALEAAARQASDGIGETMTRLKLLLEG